MRNDMRCAWGRVTVKWGQEGGLGGVGEVIYESTS